MPCNCSKFANNLSDHVSGVSGYTGVKFRSYCDIVPRQHGVGWAGQWSHTHLLSITTPGWPQNIVITPQNIIYFMLIFFGFTLTEMTKTYQLSFLLAFSNLGSNFENHQIFMIICKNQGWCVFLPCMASLYCVPEDYFVLLNLVKQP